MNKNLELEDVERWTLEQIAKEKTGGCLEQAKIWAKDLVMVDHESASLHALGHRQFIVTNTKRRKIHGTEELAGTTKEAGMSNQSHQACAAELATAMESSGSNAGGGGGGRGGGGSKTVSKVVPPPPGLNAEELKAHEEKMAKIKKGGGGKGTLHRGEEGNDEGSGETENLRRQGQGRCQGGDC